MNNEISKICLNCEINFMVPYKRRHIKFCCLVCAYEFRRHDKIQKNCLTCDTEMVLDYGQRERKFCSYACSSKWQSKYYIRSEETRKKMSELAKGKPAWNKGKTANDDSRILSGSKNPAFGKVYNTKENNPEWADKISKTLKERSVNIGDKNGMKKPEAKKKASETRKKKFKEDPEFAKQHAEMTKKSWADGKHEHTQVGRCKWYDYTKKDGIIIKCQGTWELAFAKWADENGLKFDTHRGRIEYVDNNGEKKNYYPDFYIYDWESYADTKSEYFQALNKNKIECIIKSNPNLKLKILGRNELLKLGIKLK